MDRAADLVYFWRMRFTEHPLRLTSAGRHRAAVNWQLGPDRTQQWSDLDLWLLVDGHGSIETPSGGFRIAPGSCLLLRGGEAYRFHQDAGSTFTHYWAHFDYCSPRGRILPRSAIASLPLHHQVSDVDLLTRLWDRVIATQCEQTAIATRCFDAVLAELDFQRLHQAAPATADAIDRVIHRAMRSMRDDPALPHGVAGYAHEAAVSRSQFTRRFRVVAECSPRQYVTEQRLRLAASLLRESSLSVTAIAERVGYNDVHFFSRHFRRHQGASPSAVRGQ
jgi:AraC-like DNA-binding protein